MMVSKMLGWKRWNESKYQGHEQESNQYIDDISINSTEYKRPPLVTALSVCSSMLWEFVCVQSVLFMLFCSSVHHLLSSVRQSVVKWCVGVRHSNGSITQRIRLFLLTEHEGALFSPNVVKVMIHSALQWWYWVT